MSTIATTNLKNPSSGSNNIALGTDGSTRISTLADSAGANTSTPAEIASGRAKAWVNFNGTGTVAIRASYNVSSITDNGVGNYTVNFTTAMPDVNYAPQISSNSAGNSGWLEAGTTMTASTCSIFTTVHVNFTGDGRTATDYSSVFFAIFR